MALTYYNSGATSPSPAVPVTVSGPLAAPTFNAPTATVFDLGSSITFDVSVTPVAGAAINLVGIYDGATPVAFASAAPYTATWTPTTGGVKNVTAAVYYSNGQVATSVVLPITINGAVAAPISITVPATNTTGSYTVSWAASTTVGATYTLEESSDPNFNLSTVLGTGLSVLSVDVTGKQTGTYYYRVKATKSPMVDSQWMSGINGCSVLLIPTSPNPIAPIGTITVSNPTYTWSDVVGASSYDIYTSTNGVTALTNYTSAVSNCVPGGTCNIISPTLNPGDRVSWLVRARNSTGISAWSAVNTFTYSPPVVIPVTPTPIAPMGTVSVANPSIVWSASDGATAYDIYSNTNGVTALQSYTSATANCTVGGTCSIISPTLTPGDNVSWLVRARNSAGISSWSAVNSFTYLLPVVVPITPTPIAPIGTVSVANPSYVWSASDGATSYDIYSNTNGVTALLNYSSAAASCTAGGNCSIVSSTLTPGDNVSWLVRARNSAGISAWSQVVRFSY